MEKPPEIMQNLRSQVSKALIDYDHGIISCFKLIENLFLFRDDYGISLSNLNKLKMDEGSLKMDEGSLKIDERFLISQEILKTIRYHSTTDTRISDAYLIYLWFNILDDICEWSRYTKAEGYCNVPGFCEVEVEAFSLKKVEVKFSYADYPKNYKPYLQYEALTRKYYQIINHNIETNIEFIISDKDNNKKYKFDRKKGNGKNKYCLRISGIDIENDKLLECIIEKDGLKNLLKKTREKEGDS
ncbi:MAG: hypothetical protein A7315_14665 [Candidatus Altiarchaeales archaeon WOR_SM1_79]|nr:MAG: hypothetical protein A7315_14665 [Candidatus Altiarchaeales archaeon WOR_SM1_79]